MENKNPFPLVAVVGPTGSGKTALALRLAREFEGEIVNCDSLQVYRYFNIGTAKLPLGERAGIPHHLLDVAEPGMVYTAGEYARQGRQALNEIAGRGRLPVIAGGTGFYLSALLDGLFAGPERDPALRRDLAERERTRPGSLHRLLRRFDPSTAARIHERDRQKTMRALEVCLLTRRPLTSLFAAGRDSLEGFKVLKIGLSPPRSDLYRRLELRARGMFESGLIDEVRGILAMGYSTQAKPFEALGYKQALKFLAQEYTLDEAIESTRIETRRFAKRQWTWFRRDPEIRWLDGFGSEPAVRQAAAAAVRDLLFDSG